MNNENKEIIISDETDKPVVVDPKLRSLGFALHSRIEAAVLVTAMALKKIRDDKLYHHMGFSSFREYCEELPFSHPNAKKYLQIGDHLGGILPEIAIEQNDQGLLASNTGDFEQNETVQQLSALGLRKLRALVSIDNVSFKDLPSKGEIKLENGEVLTLEEIREETAAELDRKVAAVKKKLRDQLRTAEEKAALAESERDALSKQIEDLQKQNADIKVLEERFGNLGTTFEVAKRKLTRIHELCVQLSGEIKLVRVPEDIQRMLAKDIMNVVSVIRVCADDMELNHLTALEEFGFIRRKKAIDQVEEDDA